MIKIKTQHGDICSEITTSTIDELKEYLDFTFHFELYKNEVLDGNISPLEDEQDVPETKH